MRIRRPIILSVLVVLVIGAVALVIRARAAQRQAQSLGCASSVVSVCHGGLLWAEDHGGYFPTNFIMASNEIVTPQVLSSVPSRRVRSWSAFTPNNSTYEIVTPGVHRDDKNTVFLRCTIHGHLGYPDRTVFDGVRRRSKEP
jgi:hypothetical protein